MSNTMPSTTRNSSLMASVGSQHCNRAGAAKFGQRAVWVALAVLILLLTSPGGSAWAQSDNPQEPDRSGDAREARDSGDSDARVQEAQALFDEGIELLNQALIADARDRFEKALALRDHPLVHYNLGLCLRSMGHPIEAYEHLLEALRSDKLSPEQRAQGQKYVEELRQQIAELRVVCKESGARVSLDGEPLFAAPGTITRLVLPGPRQLVAQKSLRLASTRTVNAEPGKRLTVELFLPTLERPFNQRLPWLIMGSGAAVSLVGVPLYLLARSTAADFRSTVDTLCAGENQCEMGLPEPARDLESRSKRYNALAVASFVIGGAAITTGVVLALLNQPRVVQPEERRGDVSVVPVITPDLAGASARWSF